MVGSPQQQGSIFVGRERELAESLAGLADAIAGRGRLLLVGGEPGIGKTRLADEVAAVARSRGCEVLWGRAWEDAGAPPYWPWIQVLRAHLRSIAPDELDRQLGSGAADVAQMLPDLGAIAHGGRPSSAARTGSLDPASADPAVARFRLFDSTTAFLISAARQVPLVLMLEDLHAADADSILLLRFLTRQIADSPILVLATYRDIELTPEHPLGTAVAELMREPSTRAIPLGGLTEEAVSQFIEAAAGVRPGARFASRVWRETRGNPLFLSEAVRLVRTDAQLDQGADLESLGLKIPAGIRQAINRRIGQLGPTGILLLQHAAALGPEFTLESLELVTGERPDVLTGLLDEAVQAGLLALGAGSHAADFRFAHDLVRETLYVDLSPPDRIRLHRRIAEALEQRYASTGDPHLAELAYHFYRAMPGGERRKAIEYARQAGAQAAEALAYEEAARFYSMAVQALGGEATVTEGEHAEMLLLLGESQARAGDVSSAQQSFLEAATIAARIGSGDQLGRAALGYGGRFVWSRAGSDTHLIPLLQDALGMLGDEDARLVVRVRARLACAWRSSSEHFEESAALTDRALEIARRLGDPSTLRYALVGRFWATFWPDNPQERLEIAKELLAMAEGSADSDRRIDARQALWIAYLELALILEARAQLEKGSREVVELRQPTQVWAVRTYEVVLALMEGAYDHAAALLETAGSIPVNAIRDNVSTLRSHQFLLAREQGRLAEEEASVRAAAAEFPWYPLHRAALACLLLDLGRRAEAKAVFDELAQGQFKALYRDCEWLYGMALASDACAGLSDSAAAESLYTQLMPFAGRHAVAHSEGSLGAVDRYLGLLATTLGRLEAAERHFQAAIDLNERMGARPWTAHTRVDFAQMLTQRGAPGDEERATAMLSAARVTARQLGMTRLASLLATEPAVADAAGALSVSEHKGSFRREGEFWTVTFDGQTARLRDTKGMRYLSQLLGQPGREMHALELVGVERNGPGEPTSRSPIEGLDAAGLGDAGEVLDSTARRAYRERLAELEVELAEAEAWNDPERVARVRVEREHFIRELAAAVGLGGRSRVAASAAERARQSVAKAIRATIQRIEGHSAPLGRHLALTVHTGTFCSYDPDPTLALTWEL